jgi:hypothetical protein
MKYHSFTAWVAAAILLAAAACSPKATPSPSPAPTDAPTSIPTELPTIPPLPTEIPSIGVTPAGSQPTAAAGATNPTAAPAAGETTGAATAAPAIPVSGSGAADKYQFISQNIADNTQVRPGTPLTITWTVKNAGTTTWSTSYLLRYFSGPQASESSYAFPHSVAPGATLQLTVKLTAPQEAGDYNTWWKLTNDQMQNFGDVNLQFTVTNTPGSVPTPTP